MRFARIPGVRRLPSGRARVEEDLVVFDSWGGRFSDNPRAISEEMHRRDLPFRQVWVLEPGRSGPDWADTVVPGTRQHLSLLGQAGYLVCNNTLPGFFRKSAETTFVQTWHGTPLKRIGFDLPDDGSRHRERYLAHLAREVQEWDIMLSPNPPSTKWLRRAFRYRGRVLESGYPRNDVLAAPGADLARARVRRELGVGPDAFVVLYAPTFREIGAFDLELDLGELADGLGPKAHVLIRRHHLAAQAEDGPAHPRVHDVTRREDPRELYLAADALVTDYSSVMFDFAVTGKPMVFFTYDLAHYRDELRGFYFPFEREAPGPIVNTGAEVLERLRDPEALTRRWATEYQRFRNRFCCLEDGGAARRVVDAMLALHDGHDREGRFSPAGAHPT
jgi:CDP-glycerol glycerophosphotransferase